MNGIGGTDHTTLELADGDNNPRTASTISGDEQAIYCMNGKPNVFNEPNCKLSTEVNACVREGIDDEDTVTVTTLSETSISAINGHIYIGDELLAIGVPAMITGLVISSTDYPCTMGYVSRWIENNIADETACYTNSNHNPAEDTKSAFQHLLGYAVSNNEAGILDVLMVSMHTNLDNY